MSTDLTTDRHQRVAQLLDEAPRFRAAPEIPVSEWAIRAWNDAMQVALPADEESTSSVSPVTMQSWTRSSLQAPGAERETTAIDWLRNRLHDLGFTAVVATTVVQDYVREVRVGDVLAEESRVVEISGPKTTGLGTGHFGTTEHVITDLDGNPIGTTRLTIFYFDPTSDKKTARRAGPPDEAASPEGTAIQITPTVVIASALASNDFERVHHDHANALAEGLTGIIPNITTSAGWVDRVVRRSLNAGEIITRQAVRLGAPCFPGDTLTITVERGLGSSTFIVTGRHQRGVHLTAKVEVEAP